MDYIKVNTQFHNKYASIATRQCSWFCFEAMQSRKELVDSFNTSKYKSVYHDCLMEATINKKNSKDREAIETLFHENILSKYKGIYHFFKMEYNVDGYDYYEKLSYSNTSDVIRTKKSYSSISEADLITKLDKLEKYDYMMVNRLVMSFIVINVDTNKFLLVDPHIKISLIISIDAILHYIKYDDDSNYNLVTLVFGE
jgi:hypothetical protein